MTYDSSSEISTVEQAKQQLAQERLLFEKEKADLKQAPRLQNTGWSYMLGIVMALMAPAIFVDSVKFNQQGALESIDVKANPVLVLGYFGLIGAIIGAPTTTFMETFGSVLIGVSQKRT